MLLVALRGVRRDVCRDPPPPEVPAADRIPHQLGTDYALHPCAGGIGRYRFTLDPDRCRSVDCLLGPEPRNRADPALTIDFQRRQRRWLQLRSTMRRVTPVAEVMDRVSKMLIPVPAPIRGAGRAAGRACRPRTAAVTCGQQQNSR
jgi:hypothetical protein